MGIVVTIAASTYPVTKDEAKNYCRVTSSRENDLFDSLIASATDYVEQYLGRSIMAQTLKLTTGSFTDEIILRRGPVSSVTSVKYYDSANVEQTVSSANYTVDLSSDPSLIARNSTYSWPAVYGRVDAVNIVYVCGYATVPPAIKAAILMLIAQWYDNRAPITAGSMPELPNTVTALLANFRSFA